MKRGAKCIDNVQQKMSTFLVNIGGRIFQDHTCPISCALYVSLLSENTWNYYWVEARIFKDHTCPVSCALDMSENIWSARNLQGALDILYDDKVQPKLGVKDVPVPPRMNVGQLESCVWSWTFEPVKTPLAADTRNLFCSIISSTILIIFGTQYRNTKSTNYIKLIRW